MPTCQGAPEVLLPTATTSPASSTSAWLKPWSRKDCAALSAPYSFTIPPRSNSIPTSRNPTPCSLCSTLDQSTLASRSGSSLTSPCCPPEKSQTCLRIPAVGSNKPWLCSHKRPQNSSKARVSSSTGVNVPVPARRLIWLIKLFSR